MSKCHASTGTKLKRATPENEEHAEAKWSAETQSAIKDLSQKRLNSDSVEVCLFLSPPRTADHPRIARGSQGHKACDYAISHVFVCEKRCVKLKTSRLDAQGFATRTQAVRVVIKPSDRAFISVDELNSALVRDAK